MDLDGIQYLAVKSNFPKKLRGRFAGIDYEWKTGDTVNMPVDAARHIFGFLEDDKTRAFHRLGWLTSTDDMEAALAKLGKISFEPIEQVFEIASQRRAPRARRISNERPPVNAGGSDGAAPAAPDDLEDDLEDDEGETAEA